MEITPEEKERLVDLEMAQFRAALRAKESAANQAAADVTIQATVEATLKEALSATKPEPEVQAPLILGTRMILAVLVTAGVGAGILLLLANSNLAPSPRHVPLRAVKQTIALGQAIIRANSYIVYRVEIVRGMQDAVVAGDFRILGDPGAGIACVITGTSDLINWLNGHVPPLWQTSGPTNNGTIEAHLGPGNYYLVFSNRVPPFSDKQVVLDLRLKYLSALPGGGGR